MSNNKKVNNEKSAVNNKLSVNIVTAENKIIADYTIQEKSILIPVKEKMLSLNDDLSLNFYVNDILITDTMLKYNKYTDNMKIKSPEKSPISAENFLLREIIRIFGLIGGQSINFDIDINSSIIDMVKNITFNKKHFTLDILQDIINTVNIVYTTNYYGKKFIFLYGYKYECIEKSTNLPIFQIKFSGMQAVKSALIQCNKTTANMFEKFTFNKID